METFYAVVWHFWAVVPKGFSHFGMILHNVASNGLPTGLGPIGF